MSQSFSVGTSELRARLFAVKGELTAVPKSTSNPYFKSMYADINALLEAVEPLLRKNGLYVLQPIEGNRVCTYIVDAETGAHVCSALELPPLTDPQKLGSCVTYFRRYTLQSLLSMQAVDDDGNHAANVSNQPMIEPMKISMKPKKSDPTAEILVRKRLQETYLDVWTLLPEQQLRDKYVLSPNWDNATLERGIEHLKTLITTPTTPN